jgi:hypothetical protein
MMNTWRIQLTVWLPLGNGLFDRVCIMVTSAGQEDLILAIVLKGGGPNRVRMQILAFNLPEQASPASSRLGSGL